MFRCPNTFGQIVLIFINIHTNLLITECACVCVCLRSALGVSGSSYTPVFLNGWKPIGAELEGWKDPVQSEHSNDEEQEKSAVITTTTLHPVVFNTS